METVKILVLSEEHWIALDLKHRLIRLGYGAAMAHDTGTAISLLHQFQPKLVLVNGTFTQLWNHPPFVEIVQTSVPMILFSPQASGSCVAFSQLIPCLTNPWEDDALVAAIEHTLHQHQASVGLQIALQEEIIHQQRQTQLVRAVDHEIRTPLSTLLITLDYLEELEQEEPAPMAQKKNCLQRARNSVDRIHQLLDRTSLFCQSQAGSKSFCPFPLHLANFCRSIVNDFRTLYGEALAIVFSEGGDQALCDREVVLDATVLRHILTNLLSNAVKYSPQGHEIQFHLIHHPDEIIFCIQDQGIGIPSCEFDQLFTPFHRGCNVGNIGGTGLGLSIVKQLVSAYQGQVTVESTVGVGSTFKVTIPYQNSTVLN